MTTPRKHTYFILMVLAVGHTLLFSFQAQPQQSGNYLPSESSSIHFNKEDDLIAPNIAMSLVVALKQRNSTTTTTSSTHYQNVTPSGVFPKAKPLTIKKNGTSSSLHNKASNNGVVIIKKSTTNMSLRLARTPIHSKKLVNEMIKPKVKRQRIQVEPSDWIYNNYRWDAAPVVVEKFNLVFFTIAKVGCTNWKKLFRRMMGYKDWSEQRDDGWIPNNPSVNGLKYLHHYSLSKATRFMTSPVYTRAIFVRDPKERFLSAYIDKAVNGQGNYLKRSCFRRGGNFTKEVRTLQGFLNIIKICNDDHWNPQSRRIDKRFWRYINFVGHMENVAVDARRLLESIGAWEEYGKSGWGRYGNESVFATAYGVTHGTGAAKKVNRYITSPDLDRQIEEYYAEDYASPCLNLTTRASLGHLHHHRSSNDTTDVSLK